MASAQTRLLEALQADLVAANLVRQPGTNDPTKPPLWMDPADGAPAPGEKNGTVEDDPATTVSAFLSGAIPPEPGMTWQRQATVDLWLRTKGSKPVQRALDLEAAVRNRLLGTQPFRVNFDLASGTAKQLRVIECRVWRDVQRLGSSTGQGYTYVVAYWFQLYEEPNPFG